MQRRSSSPRDRAGTRGARKPLSLDTQQMLALAAMLVPLVVVGAFGLATLKRTTDALQRSAEEVAMETGVLVRARSGIGAAQGTLTWSVLRGDPAAGARFESIAAEVDRELLRLENFDDATERRLANSARHQWRLATSVGRSYLATSPLTAGTGVPSELAEFYTGAARALDDLDRLAEAGARDVAADADLVEARQRAQLWFSVAVFLISSLAALVLARALRRSINRPLGELQRAAARFGAKDLSHRLVLERDDELGEVASAFNAMADQLLDHTRQLLAINRITEMAQNVPSPDDLLARAAGEIAAATGFPLVAVQRSGDAPPLGQMTSSSQDHAALWEDKALRAIPEAAVRAGAPVVVAGGAPGPDGLAPPAGLGTVISLPIRANGILDGAITLAHPDRVDVDAERIGAAQRLADHLAAVYERRHGEEALRESEERFAAVADSTGDWVWASDLQGRLTYSNAVVEAVLGYSVDEVVGQNGFALVHDDDLARLEVELAATRERHGGRTDSVAVRLRHRDGGYRWLEGSLTAAYDRSGEPTGYRGSGRDITERLEVERELHALTTELEERVAERTRQLEETNQQLSRREAQLVAAKVSADRANRAKSDFLSRMSHELRTPLNTILGFAQLLEMDAVEPAERESVERILKGGHHLLQLINEVLDISRIEAGTLSLSLEPVHLTASIAEALDLIEPLARQEGLHVRAELSDLEGAWVCADRQRLKQVLLNLLANAVKYNVEDGTVGVGVDLPGDGCARVTVTNTGRVIPAEERGRLFWPFERLGAERTRVEGAGLGLAVAKQLVDAMSGSIGVEALEDRAGSAFWFSLPLTEEADVPGAAVEPQPRPPADGAARTVLYVEDDPASVRLMERLVAYRPNVDLLHASTGAAALELARRHRPHLVLLDLDLPDIPGSEVLHLLRSQESTRDIPVLAVSADANTERVRRLLGAGAADYVTKPLELRAFLRVLDARLHDLADTVRG